jgi:putative transposase
MSDDACTAKPVVKIEKQLLILHTKHRASIFTNEHFGRLREILVNVSETHSVRVLQIFAEANCVQLVLKYPSATQLSPFIKSLKGESSRQLQSEFPEIAKRCEKYPLWSFDYFITNSVSIEIVPDLYASYFFGRMGPELRSIAVSELVNYILNDPDAHPELLKHVHPHLYDSHKRIVVSTTADEQSSAPRPARKGNYPLHHPEEIYRDDGTLDVDAYLARLNSLYTWASESLGS